MKAIVTHWYDVNEAMPPDDETWRIVRAVIHSGEDSYLMASFLFDENKWAFFQKPVNDVKVTHWCDINHHMFRKGFHMVETGVQLL